METSASNDTNNNINNNNNNNINNGTTTITTTTTTTTSNEVAAVPNVEVDSVVAPPPSPLSESPVHTASLVDDDDDEDGEDGDEMFHEIENELMSLNLENGQLESLQAMEVTCIKESLKEDQLDENNEVDLEDVPLNEEPDTLSPLLVDNHTHVQHQEMLVSGHYSDEGVNKRTLNPLARSFMLRDADSSDEGKDKKDEDDGPMEIPDDDTCVKIVEQVEFYFSNDSLLKDAFLLKHVRRNKEGFVSLKLVSSFKRVRQICKDWRAVGYAIKKCSGKIELNDVGSKIRRIDPLPLYDETLPSRTIVATGLPFEKLTIEKVSDIFSKCGEIALVRILRPGGQIPADVRQFMNKHPELLENECALVEFTESSSARIAQRMEGIYVLELVLPKKKTGKKANVTKLVENLKYSSESDNERNRGGENVRFLKRNNSVFYVKPEYVPSAPRRSSCGETTAFEAFQAKRFQNMQNMQALISQPVPERRFSNCSDGYSSCNEVQSRRSSMCSDLSRRFSNTSDFSRRYSNCSDMMCNNCRRPSDNFRRSSNGSTVEMPMRKFSVERRFSNTSDRRISMEHERKISAGSMNSGGNGIVYERKYSNGFDPFRKLSNTDQYFNGRRISTDSGYDRRTSFGSSDASTYNPVSPIMNRPRSGSLFNNESVVRTPIGPDGSKGFQRARRIGQVVPPI